MKLLLLILALLCFLIATIVAWGEGSFAHAGALIPLGLLFGFGSFLPLPS